MKKVISLLLVAMLAVIAFAGCNNAAPAAPAPEPEKPAAAAPAEPAPEPAAPAAGSLVSGKTFGAIIPGPDVYYNYGKSGVKWATEASGNTYVERNSENNTVKEVQNVEDLISAQVDAILLMTTNSDTGQKGAQLANAAGIPFFLFDCEIADGPGVAQGAVTTPLPDIGSLMAEWCVKNDVGGDYVILAGLPGQPGGEIQLAAFREVFEKVPTNKLLSEVQYADWDRKKGEDLMRNYLIMHDKIDLVYAMNEEMAYGSATAIAEAGRSDEMVIVSANGSPVGKEMLQAGTLLGTTGWSNSENGILVVLKALEYLNGTPQDFQTFTPIDVFTKDNLADFPIWDVEGQIPRYEPIFREKGFWAGD